MKQTSAFSLSVLSATCVITANAAPAPRPMNIVVLLADDYG